MAMIDTIEGPVRVVALGGGTGLPVVLRGFKPLVFPRDAEDQDRLVAVVTVSDDGGSSGRLRDELGIIPPGDIRNCLVALSHNEPLMTRLFQARYRTRGELDGHAAGNLILAALAQEEGGNVLAAIRMASEVLNIHGRVLPSSLHSTVLFATLRDGREVEGESNIAAEGSAVTSIRLVPEAPAASPGVVDAIRRAQIVVLGPGSLYTSILPNLLVPEIAEALRTTKAFRILVVNAMTEPGETEGLGAADHARAVLDHVGADSLDAVLLSDDDVPESILERYALEGAQRVNPEDPELTNMVPRVARRNVLETGTKVRHDPYKTAGSILLEYRRWSQGDKGRVEALQETTTGERS